MMAKKKTPYLTTWDLETPAWPPPAPEDAYKATLYWYGNLTNPPKMHHIKFDWNWVEAYAPQCRTREE